MRNWQSLFLKAYVLLWLLVPVMQTITLPSIAQADGTFPPQEFNGLQIAYSVSGASLNTPEDSPGFTWTRTETGKLTGSTLTVSGNVIASMGYGAGVRVSVSAGDQQNSFNASWSKQNSNDSWNQPFSVSVKVPPDATEGYYSISLTGDYNAGTRGVDVKGSLTRDVSTSSNSSSRTNTSILPNIPTWVVAVGGGSVVVAAAAAAAAAAIAISKGSKAGNKSSQDDESDQEPQTQYILQLSSDSLLVTPDTPAGLTVSAWKTTGGSPPQPAPEASLRIVVPPSSGLQATPGSGQGSIQASISAIGATATNTVVLEVVGEAGGSQIRSTVSVQVDVQDYVLEVT